MSDDILLTAAGPIEMLQLDGLVVGDSVAFARGRQGCPSRPALHRLYL